MLLFVAAVPKSSHYGIFGIIKHKLGLSSGRSKSKHREGVDQEDVDLAGYAGDAVLESPQVVRIKCEEGVTSMTGITGDNDSEPGSPVIVRRKVNINRGHQLML